jgi:hypothetical protein
MPFSLEKLPWVVKFPAGIVGTILSAILTSLFDSFKPLGIGLTVCLAVWVVVGATWHWTNEWRVNRGKPKLQFDPTYIVAAGLILAGIGVALQAITQKSPRQDTEIQSKITALQASFDKFLKPRELSEAQAEVIEKYLLERTKSTIRFIFDPGNNEAANYAGQLFNAFRRGLWQTSIVPQEDGKAIGEALSVTVKYTANDAPKGSLSIGEIAQQAMQKANIPINGIGSGTDQSIKETVVFVYVGHLARR